MRKKILINAQDLEIGKLYTIHINYDNVGFSYYSSNDSQVDLMQITNKAWIKEKQVYFEPIGAVNNKDVVLFLDREFYNEIYNLKVLWENKIGWIWIQKNEYRYIKFSEFTEEFK